MITKENGLNVYCISLSVRLVEVSDIQIFTESSYLPGNQYDKIRISKIIFVPKDALVDNTVIKVIIKINCWALLFLPLCMNFGERKSTTC